METLLIALIVALAGTYLIRRFWKGAKGSTSCGCGCSSCGSDIATCSDPVEAESRES